MWPKPQFPAIWSHLQKISLIENLFFCAVFVKLCTFLLFSKSRRFIQKSPVARTLFLHTSFLNWRPCKCFPNSVSMFCCLVVACSSKIQSLPPLRLFLSWRKDLKPRSLLLEFFAACIDSHYVSDRQIALTLNFKSLRNSWKLLKFFLYFLY